MKTREVKHHDFSDKSVRIRLKESLFENINYLIIPFFLGYEEIGKNYYNELQFYDFYMINYTISGNARFTVNNLTFDIEQGDLILLHAYQKRIFVPEGPWNIYCMHIKDDGSQLANLYGKFHNDNNYIIKNFPRDIIEKHFSKISESMQSFTPDLYELSVETYSLFVDIIEFSDSRKHVTIPNELKNAMNFLENNFDLPVTLNGIAEVSGYSASHLEKLFKEYTGNAPMQYLNNLRLERAKRLLSSTQLPLADVAAQTGFKNDRSLMYMFKNRYGTSPTQYRKRGGKDEKNEEKSQDLP